MKKISWKHMSNIFKVIGAVFTMLLIVIRLIWKDGNLTVEYVLACGIAGIIVANIFISIDISMWIVNFQKAKHALEGKDGKND